MGCLIKREGELFKEVDDEFGFVECINGSLIFFVRVFDKVVFFVNLKG